MNEPTESGESRVASSTGRAVRLALRARSMLNSPLSHPATRTCLIAAAVAVFDLLMPLGVTAAALYMAAVLSAVPIRHPRAVIITAAVCSVLLAIDTAVSPGRGQTELWKVIVNNLISLLVVWGTALMADSWIRVQRSQVRQAQENQLLLQAMSLSVVSHSFEDALRSCVGIMCEITRWPVGHVYFHDSGRDRLISSDIWALPNVDRYVEFRKLTDATEFKRGEGIPGRIWQSGQSQWFSELHDPRFSPQRQFPMQGAFAFPIIADDQLIAVMEFYSLSSAPPEPHLLLLAGSVGQQLGQVAERRRRVAERSRIAAIVESSYDAIIGRDLGGRITSWNKGAELVYGYTEDEAIGQLISILLPAGMDSEEPAIADALDNRRRLTEFETIRRRKDGQVIDVALTVSPILDSRDQLVGSSTIERDITLRRRREKELQSAREAAEFANQAKSTILANVSHELRTPMNAVLGMLDLALSEPLADELRDNLNTARDSARTLLYLLNDLLDVSRMEAGRFELEREPFAAHEVFEGAVRALAIRASEKGLELVLRIARDVPHKLIGDGFRLGQIVTNLAGNALKFTDQGEVCVDVSVASRSGTRVELRIAVRDTGVGVAPEHQEHIFAPFSQVDPSTTRKHTGSGLGLTICREIADKMQGRLWLESRLGVGSTFFCTGWFDEQSAEADSSPETKTHQGLYVLVVDDNAASRELLCELLAERGIVATACASGEAATQILKETREPFDALIVDALMPGMDGFTLIESLDRSCQNASPPVILMLTASDRQTFRARATQVNADAFLEKPVTRSALLDAFSTVFGGVTTGAEMPESAETAAHPRRVLLVEDIPANQRFMRAILEKRGHHVRIAGNGREAVEQLKQDDFDVVLMDVQMPTMDGLQATQAIRGLEAPSKSRIPIIALTAHARKEDRAKCFDAGMDAALEKPVNISEVVRLVETMASAERPDGFASSPLDGDSKLNGAGFNQVIDLKAARQRMDGNEALLADMARYFLDDAPRLLGELETMLVQGDASNAQRAAHSLKGLASNFGARHVTAVAQRIEDLARQEELATARTLTVDLAAEVGAVDRELRSSLQL
jgi:PAS domain S-box-containing protein